jgi:hypothetical protein
MIHMIQTRLQQLLVVVHLVERVLEAEGMADLMEQNIEFEGLVLGHLGAVPGVQVHVPAAGIPHHVLAVEGLPVQFREFRPGGNVSPMPLPLELQLGLISFDLDEPDSRSVPPHLQGLARHSLVGVAEFRRAPFRNIE